MRPTRIWRAPRPSRCCEPTLVGTYTETTANHQRERAAGKLDAALWRQSYASMPASPRLAGHRRRSAPSACLSPHLRRRSPRHTFRDPKIEPCIQAAIRQVSTSDLRLQAAPLSRSIEHGTPRKMRPIGQMLALPRMPRYPRARVDSLLWTTRAGTPPSYTPRC